MEYLHYQLHVSASTLAIVRFVFNLLSNYTICAQCNGAYRRPPRHSACRWYS